MVFTDSNIFLLLQMQVQRSHPSQTDVISSALQTMSFPKTDAEYEKDIKLAFTFNESDILNDTQSSEFFIHLNEVFSSN